jgi:autotransporter-associated beta strand protein
MLSWGAVAGAVLIAVLLVAPTQAASYSWNQLTGGTWSELANWDTAVDPKDAPNGDAADVSIKQDVGPGATYADLTITLSANTTVNAIRFDDTGSGTDSRLAIGSSGITLTFGGNAPVVESTSSYSGGYGLQINPVVDVGTAGVTKMGWGTVRFNNSIKGGGTITVQQGTLELVGSSSGFTGKLVIQNGATLQARTIPGTGADVLGSTSEGVQINGTGRFQFRDASNKTCSEPFEVNGINSLGSIMLFAGGNVTINGPVKLNSDTSFSIADYAGTGNTVGAKRDFYINSLIADGAGGPHSVYFLGEYGSSSARGTESRKSEMILGVKNTYGGNTYITTNTGLEDASNPFSGNLRLGIENALPTGTIVCLGGDYYLGSAAAGTLGHAMGSGKLALAGRNQELAGLLTKGAGLVNRVVGASATLSTLTLNIASGVNNTYGGFLGWTDTNDDNLALIKKGAGILALTAANTYAGGTIVREGTLLVNNTTDSGSGTGRGSVTVETGATLGGSGTISGQISVAAGGHLAPGNSPGILHTGNVTLASGAYFDVELNGTAPGSGYDQLDLDGVINLSDAQLNVLLGFSPSIGDQFTIIDNDGVERVTGDFAGLNEGSLFSTPFGSQRFLITYLGGDGNDVVLTAVPEPSSLALVASLFGLTFFYRRRTRDV